MHLLGPTLLGIGIVLLLGALVAVKQIATGTVLDKPRGNFLVQLVNVFNLFFLLVVNPLAAVGLLWGGLPGLDPTHIALQHGPFLWLIELIGLLLYLAGFFLMGWALLTLGRYYQLGGSAPRSEDKMVTSGPYQLVRHPMYSAALSISLGLALLLQSAAFFVVFLLYVALMFGLIPLEERELRNSYGEQYQDYRRRTKILIPAIY